MDQDMSGPLERCINQHSVSKAKPNLEILCPNFGWLSLDRIKKTIQATTQFAWAAHGYPFCKHYKTRWPAANVTRCNEEVATNTIFSDTPAHMMLVSLVMVAAPWPRSLLERKVPRPLHMG
jgi:hypothetical protein